MFHRHSSSLVSLTGTVLFLFVLPVPAESAPIPVKKKSEIDPEIIKKCQELGGEFGYFVSSDDGGIPHFMPPQVPAARQGVPGFRWGVPPEQWIEKMPEVDVPFGIEVINVAVTDKDVKQIAVMKNLTALLIPGSQVTQEGIRDIAELTKLTCLDMSSNVLTDEQLEILRPLKKMRCLILHNTQITDKGVSELARFEDLTFLNVMGTQVTADGLKALRHAKKLNCLMIDQFKVNDDLLKELKTAGIVHCLCFFTTKQNRRPKDDSEVEKVDLNGCPLTNDGLHTLNTFKNLKELYLNSTRVDDEGMKEVGRFEKLTVVYLNANAFTAKGLAELAPCKSLNQVFFPFHQITDETIRTMKKIGLLHALMIFNGEHGRPKNSDEVRIAQVQGTRITIAGIKEFVVFKNLDSILVYPQTVTLAMVKDLNSVGLLHTIPFVSGGNPPRNRPKSKDEVKVLSIPPNIPQLNECLEEFSEFKNVETVVFTNVRLEEKSIDLLGKFSKLKSLHLNSGVTPAILGRVAELRNLQDLNIAPQFITDAVFADLIKSKQIRKLAFAKDKKGGRPASIDDVASLTLSGMNLTDASIKELTVFKGLNSLGLDNMPAIRGRELKGLAGLKELSSLSLSNTGIDLEGIQELKNLNKLKELNLTASPILQVEEAQKELEQLKRKWPECRILDAPPTPEDNGGG